MMQYWRIFNTLKVMTEPLRITLVGVGELFRILANGAKK